MVLLEIWVAEIDIYELFHLSHVCNVVVVVSVLGLVGNAMKSAKCRSECASDFKICNASMRDVFHGRL
jgi:hypothetical protein